MEFLPEFFDFALSEVGVESFLHFLLKLIFPFPEQDLSFALHDLVHELCLFLTNDIDIVFQLYGLVLHFLQFLYELTLQIDVLVLELALLV